MDQFLDDSWPADDGADEPELHQFVDIGLALRLTAERDRADAD